MNRIGKIRIACFILVFLGSLMFGMLSGHAVDMSEKEEGKGVLITTITYGNNYERNATASWTNPEDACIAENQYYDRTYHNGSYNGHSYDAHCASTTALYNPGTAFNMRHWFDVDLGGTYDVANVALGLSCGDKSGESNKVRCSVTLFNAAGKNVGIFSDDLNITGTMNKYFLNKFSGSIDKFTNIKKISVSVVNGAYGSIGIPTNIYYINVYRKIKSTDPGGKFNYYENKDSTELTYGTTYESFQIDTYYDTTNPPVITYNDGSDAYFTAEHWVLDATHDYIKFTPKKITGEDYYTITVSRAESRTYEAASFTVRVKINPKPLKIDEVRADNKTYDGTTAGSGSVSLKGIANNDDVTATGNFTFADKNVGTGKPVSVANIALGGTTAGNYRLDTTTGSATADILALPITITAKEQKITYGGNIATGLDQVTVATLPSGDSLTAITLTANGTNAGTWSITPSAATIKDGDADVTGNYNISYVNGTLIINRVPVDKPEAVNHTYNGTVHFGVNPQTAATGYTYSGVIQESRAGTYTATATLDGNHMWSDSTTGAVILEWNIAKKTITPRLVAEDRLYNGTIKANGTLELQEIVTGDDVSATYTECTFDSPLVGTRTATATGIALAGKAASNYTLAEVETTDDANITKAVLTAYVVSDLVNTAQEAYIKEKTAQAGTASNIKLPTNYTIGKANGSYGTISDETYTRSGVYYNALGVIEDTLASELVMENIPCVAVTYHITTGQNAVYGDNTTDTSEQTTITTYVNSADSWQIENKTRKIATNSPATATLNVYLKEGEHLLVDTAIGVYYGRMDVTVTKVNESTVLAEDKIDAFFPVNYPDDFRVSKLKEEKPSEKLTKRGDYWEEVVPFTAPSTGVYTFTITVTGKSYLHTIDERYTQNLPAQKPVTELKKFTINGTEMHGIDA